MILNESESVLPSQQAVPTSAYTEKPVGSSGLSLVPFFVCHILSILLILMTGCLPSARM
jgi:hypothetical protein